MQVTTSNNNQTTTQHTRFVERFVERQDQILALKLGWVAGEHVFFLGPPGTGKSALVEEFTSNKLGVRVFKALMTPFTTPEEIFGPIDIPHLRETGRIRRITEGFLPDAEVAFLDEIFKANSAILNSLLRIMQEREFAVEPPKMKRVPTRMIVGASNELPSGEELTALYDRFLIRSYVPYLSEAGFQKLIRGEGEEIPDLRNMEVPEDLEWISVEEEVYALLFQIRKDLLQEGIVLSDRRWKKSIHLMRAHALIRGSDTVEVEDLDVLRFVAWEKPDQIQKVQTIVMNRIAPELAEAQELVSELEKRYAELDSSNMAAVAEFLARAKTSLQRLNKLAKTAPESARTGIQSMRESVQELQKNAMELLGIER